MSRLLLVTKEYAESPTSGGTQRTLAIARKMSEYGKVVVVSPDGTWRREGGMVIRVPELPPVKFPQWRAAWAYRSLSGARVGGTELLRNLQRAVTMGWDYDAAVLDHTCLWGLHDIVANHAELLILSTHNIESKLMADRAGEAEGLLGEWSMRAEARLLARLEHSRAARTWPVLVVSSSDAAVMAKAGARPILCANGVPAESVTVPAHPLPPRRMLFTGALDWEPNVQGLEWFLLTTWPKVRDAFPDASLTIAGRNPHVRLLRAVRNLERDYHGEHAVSVVGSPASMDPLLASHGLGIVPLLSGGGSRIKILEYLAHGLDVVSTETGAAGLMIPAELMDTGPDGAIWETLMNRLKNPRDNRVAATDWVRQQHTWTGTLRALGELLAAPPHTELVEPA